MNRLVVVSLTLTVMLGIFGAEAAEAADHGLGHSDVVGAGFTQLFSDSAHGPAVSKMSLGIGLQRQITARDGQSPGITAAAQHVDSGRLSYLVRWGDTLWSIAQRHGTTVDAIMRANGLRSHRIYAGQRLLIPVEQPGGRVYVVRWGDTLWSIAQRHGTTVAAIMRANRLRSHWIYAGQRLFVPIGSPAPLPTPAPQRPEVLLSPWNGPPGTVVTMKVVGFPPMVETQIGIGPYGSEFNPVSTVFTDASGTARTTVTAEGAVGMNLVVAARAPGRGWSPGTYASAMFRVRD